MCIRDSLTLMRISHEGYQLGSCYFGNTERSSCARNNHKYDTEDKWCPENDGQQYWIWRSVPSSLPIVLQHFWYGKCPETFQALHIVIWVSKASVMSFRKLSGCKTMGNNTLSDKKKHNFPPDHHSPSRKPSFDSSSRALQCYNTVKAVLTLASSSIGVFPV